MKFAPLLFLALTFLAPAEAWSQASWLPADIRLDTGGQPLNKESTDPQMASSGNRVYVVWTDSRDYSDIYFNYSSDGGRHWQTPDLKINHSIGANAYSPAIACSGANVYVVWTDNRDSLTGHNIYFNYSTDGGVHWQDEDIRIDHGSGVADSRNPKICTVDNHIYVFWDDDRGGSTDNIYFNRSSDAGLTWEGADTQIDVFPGPSPIPGYLQVGCTAAQVYAVWRGSLSGSNNIYANHSLDHGASWPQAQRIDTPGGPSTGCTSPALSCSATHAFAVWQDERNGSRDIYFNRFTVSSASWQISDTHIDHVPDGSDAYAPQVACSGTSVCIVWADNRNGNGDIYANHSSNNGANWQSSDIRVDLGTAAGDSGSWGPRICMSGSNVYAVWEDKRDGADDIYFNLSANGGADWRSFDTRLDTGDPPGASDSINSQISCSSANVYVVWVDYRQAFPEFDIYFNAMLEVPLIANELPIAMISGSSTYCLPPKTVSLDGSTSSDPDGYIAAYDWRLLGKPFGSGAVLSSDSTIAVSFTADLPGDYVVTLMVQDNDGAWSTPVSRSIRVSAGDPPGLAIQGVRKEERAWIIRKDYAELTLTVTPPASGCPLPIASYRLQRRQDQGAWVTAKEIAPTEFTSQGHVLTLALIDKYLERKTAYTYRLVALDAGGLEAAAAEIIL